MAEDEFYTPDDRTEEQRRFDFEEAAFRVRRIREERFGSDGEPHVSTRPCPSCGKTDAVIGPRRNGQRPVRCIWCDIHIYFAPKAETGELPRSAKTVRAGLKPKRQAAILDRDHGRCVLCGRGADDDVLIHVGHLVSVEDGIEVGLSDAEINDDANIAAMCEACDLGFNRRSVSAPTLARLLAASVRVDLARRHGIPIVPLS